MIEDFQLTDKAKSELTQLLKDIARQKDVVGCLVIAHAGLLIANMNSSTIAARMGHEHITQIVARTNRGSVVIADYGGGLLTIISDDSETVPFVPLIPGLDGSSVPA